MSEGNGNGNAATADNIFGIKDLKEAAENASRRLAVDEADIRYLLDKIEAMRSGTTPWQRSTDKRIDAALLALDGMSKDVTDLTKKHAVIEMHYTELIEMMKNLLIEFRSTKAPVCTCGLQGLGGK